MARGPGTGVGRLNAGRSEPRVKVGQKRPKLFNYSRKKWVIVFERESGLFSQGSSVVDRRSVNQIPMIGRQDMIQAVMRRIFSI